MLAYRTSVAPVPDHEWYAQKAENAHELPDTSSQVPTPLGRNRNRASVGPPVQDFAVITRRISASTCASVRQTVSPSYGGQPVRGNGWLAVGGPPTVRPYALGRLPSQYSLA